jgi:NADH-quinone oxidoreductase subunit L
LAIASVGAGFLNAEPFGIHAFHDWTVTSYVEDAFTRFHIQEHPFSWGYAGASVAVALLGIALAGLYYARHAFSPLHGLTERNRVARLFHTTLLNRYYLDHLYTGVIVGGLTGPVSRIAYWINQNVLDGAVNGVGFGARKTGDFVYNVIDQKIVDGVVNGTGLSAEGGGAGLRLIQTGRVQQYAAILFGAVAIFALVLVLAI